MLFVLWLKMGCRHLGCLAVLLCLAFNASAAAPPLRNSDCLDCHSDHSLTTSNSAGREISLFVDEAKLKASVHATNLCVSCHADVSQKHPDDGIQAKPVNCATCHASQSDSYRASVHGVAFRNRDLAAATCSDCHGAHNIVPPGSAESPLNFSRLAATCGACHPQESKEVSESVHGRAVASGHRDAPTCTDCHSEHRIEGLKNLSPLKVSVQICSKCHASEQLNTKYNLPADRVQTFFESYHGLAAEYGSTVAADCASCHGVHRILPSSDANSSINPAHLVETCGKCHPGATDNFASGKIHVAVAVAGPTIGEKTNAWVRRIYLVLIVGVVGAMALHNLILFARKVAAMRRVTPRPILRMNRNQRLQHAVLVIAFVVLAVTGFALKFPDSWIAIAMGSSEWFRRGIHRIAGVVMLLGGAYHLIYIAFTPEGRQLVKDFYPRFQDVRDFLGMAAYLLGMRRNKPPVGRFGYAEKMEYWAVVWGTIIMGATGLAIWFKMDVTRFLPRWAVDVALNVHYYEAILACLAIVVWHFYHVIFDPDVYPANMVFWDGRVSEHWQKEEHPLAPLTLVTPPATAQPPVPRKPDQPPD